MNEIVERLREYSGNDPDGVRHREAASEIERLRVALVERLHDIPADLCWTEDKGAHRNIPAGAIAHEAADEIERLRAEQANLRAALDHWFALVPQADRAQFPFTGQVS